MKITATKITTTPNFPRKIEFPMTLNGALLRFGMDLTILDHTWRYCKYIICIKTSNQEAERINMSNMCGELINKLIRTQVIKIFGGCEYVGGHVEELGKY